MSNQPILVDISPPIAGIVNDGGSFRTDMKFSKDAQQVKLECVDFIEFCRVDKKAIIEHNILRKISMRKEYGH